MAIRAYVTINIKVVEQDVLACQGMMVGRDPFTEQHQLGPAVPLRHVAEDLIVRPVLFDYVENVLDRRAVFRSLVRPFSAAVNALRETLQPGAIPVELR